MKTAQILASLPDVLPPRLAHELATLQTQAPPMGPAFVRRRMRAELGDDWRDLLAAFELRPRFAASLGQVHRALGHDRRPLALKLQYPAMEEAVAADLAELRFVLEVIARKSAAVEPDAVIEELRTRLGEELDYLREAKNMALFACAFDRLGMAGRVRVPAGIAELTTGRLLAMEWLDGRPLLDIARDAPPDLRGRIGRELFAAWYRPFFSFGLLHGDPHPGNYLWGTVGEGDKGGGEDGLILLDYGCVRWFREDFVLAVGDLWRVLREGAEDAVLGDILERWGFGPLSARQLSALRPWIDLLFEPLLDDRVRPIAGDAGMAERGFEALAGVRAALQAAGRIRPPGEFVLLHRSAVLLGAVLQRIGARANWCRLFGAMVDAAERNTIARARDGLVSAAGGGGGAHVPVPRARR